MDVAVKISELLGAYEGSGAFGPAVKERFLEIVDLPSRNYMKSIGLGGVTLDEMKERYGRHTCPERDPSCGGFGTCGPGRDEGSVGSDSAADGGRGKPDEAEGGDRYRQ